MVSALPGGSCTKLRILQVEGQNFMCLCKTKAALSAKLLLQLLVSRRNVRYFYLHRRTFLTPNRNFCKGAKGLLLYLLPTDHCSRPPCDQLLQSFCIICTKALFVWAFRSSVSGKRCRKAGKQMNHRRRLLRFHPPDLRNAPKNFVWSSHLPPPFRTLRFHPPDRSATAETNEA
ncbi:hypothetical protein KSP40_PGU014151 [Platanthera guangdongensis]|uniref:Uncharacterized protein n=1 Tax=Platanthera guangdongensis TaxID=2320717 RepID=A0ABR2MR16_9ASPA